MNDNEYGPKNINGGKTPEDIDDIIRQIYLSAAFDVKPNEAASDDIESTALWATPPEAENSEYKYDWEKELFDKTLDLRPTETHKAETEKRRRREQEQKAKRRKSQKQQRRVRTVAAGLLVIIALYCVAVFSNIPFIKKWRDIYIETAMGTMTHQWLATLFIPQSVIDEVMGERTEIEGGQDGIDTDWNIDPIKDAGKKISWVKLKKSFFKIYPEIDEASFNAFMDKNGDAYVNEGGYLVIDFSQIGSGKPGIQTTSGDEVLTIDTENGIVIVEVKGPDYNGRLAIIKDASQIGLELASDFGNVGSRIAEICDSNDGILAINASGFYDPEGKGNGGVAHGLVIKDGKKYTDWAGGNNKIIGFDTNNVLNIGTYKEKNKLRDAVEFKPVLVLDGEKAIEGSAGWGIQPRSAIGQTKTGQVLLLVVDGRQVGHSIGCTMGDLADVMLRYNAHQACNLDGGSSSIMYYNGNRITKPSAGDKENGRRIPNAFVVKSR